MVPSQYEGGCFVYKLYGDFYWFSVTIYCQNAK